MRHSPAIVQVVDVPLLISPKKAESGETCPECGGPAEVDLFWSTSPNSPEVRVLKKQICCGGRPGRNSRFRAPTAHCPVQVVIVESQTNPQCEVIAQTVEAEPTFRPEEALTRGLNRAIELLASLDDQECQQLAQAARLTRELRQRKLGLKARLREARLS